MPLPLFFIGSIMCNYRKDNYCTITQEKCPWVYWCDKVMTWKELSKMPKECKIATNAQVPDGYNKVLFERKGFLYVSIENMTIKIKNPYNYIPQFVKVYKAKDEWKIRREKEKKNEVY